MTAVIDLITGFSGLAENALWVGFLVFIRVGAAMALLPAFGEQAVPQRVKLVLALAFSAVVAPAVGANIPAMGANTAVSILAEVLAGLLIGVGLRFFIHALQTAASIIAQSTTLSQLFAGTGPDPQPAFGNLFVMAGLALAMKAGMHLHAAELLILSYDTLPAGQLPGAIDSADWGLFQVARTFSLAFTLAAPFVLASFIYNVAIGVINKAMPALMVSLIGAPALAAGSLLMMAVVTPLALGVWMTALSGYTAAPLEISK
jgi:flagellar biosynthesis protein FliR